MGNGGLPARRPASSSRRSVRGRLSTTQPRGRTSRRRAHPRSVAPLEPRLPAERRHARHRARRPACIVRGGTLDPQPIDGVPLVRVAGLSGLFDVVLHPQFATNRFVYLSYNKPVGAEQNGSGVARGLWNGRALTDVRDIFVTTDSSSVSRLAFGRDGELYVSTFGNARDGMGAQDPMSLAGKVLRLMTTSSVPSDNPFSGKAGYKPEMYTLGHRSTLALAVHPGTGAVWENENGPMAATRSTCSSPAPTTVGRSWAWVARIQASQSKGFRARASRSRSSIGRPRSRSPAWRSTRQQLANGRDVFVGRHAHGRDSGHGAPAAHLVQREHGRVAPRDVAHRFAQRIRDVRQGPDELLYLLTDEDDGAILRISPATEAPARWLMRLRVSANVASVAEIEFTAIRCRARRAERDKAVIVVEPRFDAASSACQRRGSASPARAARPPHLRTMRSSSSRRHNLAAKSRTRTQSRTARRPGALRVRRREGAGARPTRPAPRSSPTRQQGRAPAAEAGPAYARRLMARFDLGIFDATTSSGTADASSMPWARTSVPGVHSATPRFDASGTASGNETSSRIAGQPAPPRRAGPRWPDRDRCCASRRNPSRGERRSRLDLSVLHRLERRSRQMQRHSGRQQLSLFDDQFSARRSAARQAGATCSCSPRSASALCRRAIRHRGFRERRAGVLSTVVGRVRVQPRAPAKLIDAGASARVVPHARATSAARVTRPAIGRHWCCSWLTMRSTVPGSGQRVGAVARQRRHMARGLWWREMTCGTTVRTPWRRQRLQSSSSVRKWRNRRSTSADACTP